MATDPVFPGYPGSQINSYAFGSSTGEKTIAKGTGNGWLVGRITLSTGNSVARTLTVKRKTAAGTAIQGVVSIPITAGQAVGVPPVDILAQVFNDVPINLALDEELIIQLDAANVAGTMDTHVEYAVI